MTGRCVGRSRRTGEQCRRPAAVGVAVCASHASPDTKRRAAEAKARKAAQWVVERHAVPVPTDPVSAIFDEIARCNGKIIEYERRIAELDPRALTFGVSKVEDIRAGQGRPGRNTTFEAKVHPLVTLLGEERDRLAKLAIDAARVDLEARRVRLDEQRTRAIVAVLDASLAELGVDPQDRSVAAVVARQIEALGGAL